MSELSPALIEHLAGVIPGVAVRLNRTCPFVSAEDLEGEMWLRAVKHAGKLAELLAKGELAVIKEDMRRAGWRACKEDERRRRAEAAHSAGYHIEDEQFYSLAALRVLLPAYLDGGIAAEPPKQRGGAGGGLISESGDFMAMMMDVSRGLGVIKAGDRRTLVQFFCVTQEDSEDGRWKRQQLASSMGLTLNTLEQRVSRSLRVLQAALGGENPWQRAPMAYEEGQA